MRLRTFWSPLPNWAYGAIPAVIAAVIAVLGFGGEDPLGAMIVGLAVGYFGGGILWAVLGVVGGDVLELDFDLQGDLARVRKSLLWVSAPDASIELYDIETVTIQRQPPRFLLLRFSSTFTVHLVFADGGTLRIGRVTTEAEALEIGTTVSDFIGIELTQPDAGERRRRTG